MSDTYLSTKLFLRCSSLLCQVVLNKRGGLSWLTPSFLGIIPCNARCLGLCSDFTCFISEVYSVEFWILSVFRRTQVPVEVVFDLDGTQMPLILVVALLNWSLALVLSPIAWISVFLTVSDFILHDHVVATAATFPRLRYQLLRRGLSVDVDIQDILLLILQPRSLAVSRIQLIGIHKLRMSCLVERCTSELWAKETLQLLGIHCILPHVVALVKHLLGPRHRQQLVILLLLEHSLLQELLLLLCHVWLHLLSINATRSCLVPWEPLHVAWAHLLLLHLLQSLHLLQLLKVVVHLRLLLKLHHCL